MSSQIAITARNLGSLTLDKYCPRCLWYLLRMKFHPPFDSFGAGIFYALEKSEKAVIGHFLESDGCLPKEFAPFCDCVERVDYPTHWSKFRYEHESGIILYGACDDIFRLKDGTLCVCDHKTAKNKGADDPFHGQYEVQVVGYSNIAEIGLELGTVTRGVLMYWEVQLDDLLNDVSGHYKQKTMSVPFIPKPLEVTIDYSILDPLLEEVNKVWETGVPPEGREGCGDCKKLDLLFAIEQEAEAQDAYMLKMFGSFRDTRNEIMGRVFRRRTRRRSALEELSQSEEHAFASDGLAGNWEFLGSEVE